MPARSEFIKPLKYRTYLVISLLVLGLFALFTGSHAQQQAIDRQEQLPTIGDPADRYLSPAQEIKIGEDFLRNIYRSGAVLEDPEISDYIQHLGDLLAGSLGTDEHSFTFFVVDDPNINAFAVPGGVIGINAGLILASNNESELAGVVAHEIAHVSQRHIARRIADLSSKQAPTLGAVLAGILLAAGGGSPDAGSALIYAGIAAQQQQFLNFTRNNEIEADRIGLQILYQSGYDPNGMADFFRSLQRQRFGRVPEQFDYLLTHPLDNIRISEAQARIDKLSRQTHESSIHYHLIKARLEALVSKDPRKLVEKLEIEQEKRKESDIIFDYAYSQALEASGNHSKATGILRRLTASDEENIAYQLAYARNLYSSGNQKKSAKILNRMLTIYPDNFPVNYYYAENLNEMQKPQEGRDLLKLYLRKNPAPTLEVYKLLAELHRNSGNEIDSNQVLAEYYFNSGNYNAAIFQLKQALKNPEVDFVTRNQIESRLREIILVTRS